MIRGFRAAACFATFAALFLCASATPMEASEMVLMYVTVDLANARTGPGTEHDVLYTLDWGAEVTWQGVRDGDWIFVKHLTPDRGAWMLKELLAPEKPELSGVGIFRGISYSFSRDRSLYRVEFETPLAGHDSTPTMAIGELIRVLYSDELDRNTWPEQVDGSNGLLWRAYSARRKYMAAMLMDNDGQIPVLLIWRWPV